MLTASPLAPPRIREEKRMKFLASKWRWSHAIVGLVIALAGCGSHSGAAPEEEAKHDEDSEAHVAVKTEPARLGVSTTTVEGLGRCEALPDHIATLTPAIEGHVHELLVAQGDPVKKGQPIVELDTAVASADLKEKTATRDGLKASLVLLKSIPRTEERRSTELSIEQAKVAVAQAKEAADRLRPLLARREVSEQQVFVANKALEQAQIQQQVAEAQLRVMMIGPRTEAVAEAEGKIKTADALVDFSKAHLDYHTIRAPIDGVLDSLHCHPGQTIAVGTPIGEVVDSRQVFASIWLPPRSAASVRVGMPAHVGHGDARDPALDASAEEEKEMDGKVAFVGRVADPQTGNLPIRVLVENPQGRLTVGQSVRVAIIVDERKGVLQVPAEAVLDLGEGPVLNVVRDGKTVVLHPQAKTPHGGSIEVAGTDLKEGEPVILEGGYNLPEGTHVKLGGEKEDAKDEEHAKPSGEKEHAKDEEPAKAAGDKEHAKDEEPAKAAGDKEHAKDEEPAKPAGEKTEAKAEAKK
jgi:RND family efflux transporter MFP subunit